MEYIGQNTWQRQRGIVICYLRENIWNRSWEAVPIKVYSFLQKQDLYREKHGRVQRGARSSQWEMKPTKCLRNPPQILLMTSPMTFGMIANLELQEIVRYTV